ncbi:MAG: Crp/Fnr family transcriptional regulator, partial [Alphaproteobacteria bacterium]|nr:Crp/Fnr family transcriptional regulator [Alphaproteobacteria bacterium]
MLQRLLFYTPCPDFIAGFPLLAGLQEHERDAFVGEGRFFSGHKKELLFRQGDPVKYFYIIYAGSVRLFHLTPEGCEVTTDIRTKRDTVGTSGLLEPTGTHHSSAEAVDDVVVMEFSRESFEKSLRALSFNLLTEFAQRVNVKQMEAEQRSVMTAVQRLACFLRRLCVANDLNPQGFDLPYSKSLMATRLGMQMETLSRAGARLKEQGISMKGKRVWIDAVPANA